MASSARRDPWIDFKDARRPYKIGVGFRKYHSMQSFAMKADVLKADVPRITEVDI